VCSDYGSGNHSPGKSVRRAIVPQYQSNKDSGTSLRLVTYNSTILLVEWVECHSNKERKKDRKPPLKWHCGHRQTRISSEETAHRLKCENETREYHYRLPSYLVLDPTI